MGFAERANEPTPRFAIIGYSARFPGAPDADAYWDVLREGRDTVSEVPADRWDVDEFFDPKAGAPGKVVSRRAGFVDDVTGFDAPFFGMSDREARQLDPQHRLLMEAAWRAVEHSGTAPTDLAGTNTGVYVGLSTHDYLGMASGQLTYPEIEPYLAIGTSNAAAAGRISFRLGLQGPAVAVDTACSSSLVAIHQACQALRLGECDLALAGGANVLLTPATMITFSSAHMLAPDGRCKTFDAAADGYVRGEGCGVIVIKRLEDAQRDGDHIRAIIRGTAINQDGASGALMVPNGIAQQNVIADALARAEVSPAEIDYLEAHGTGTALGDPIEAQAAGAVLGAGRRPGNPLLMGSVKTNIGHLEAAAGIAGVIKVVLSLENESIPRHLNFENPSPHIPWNKLAVQVVTEPTSWPRGEKPRIAGVSSFGFAGTNGHVIIEEAPVPSARLTTAPDGTDAPVDRRFSVVPLSAHTPLALERLADRYRTWLCAHDEAGLADLAFTAASARAHLAYRAALVVDSRESALELLGAVADDRPAPGLVRGDSADAPKTAWLFTGDGSQYPGMAAELYQTEPVFAETLDRCAAAIADTLDRPLLDVVFGAAENTETNPLRRPRYAQPALFATELGLARLWQSWGFEPDVVLGHGLGHYAAACVAGVFTLEDGIRLVAERGRLIDGLPIGGRMVAAFADAARVEAIVDDFPTLSVAEFNGVNTVLSGPAADVDSAVTRLTSDGVRCERLEATHAHHSALLDPILAEFEAYANTIDFQPPQRILIDNRTGDALGRTVTLSGAYWRRHARQPIEFAGGVRTLANLNCKVLLEIGPQPLLTAAALRAWPNPTDVPRTIASLRSSIADHRQIIEAVAEAYAAGHLPRFRAFRRLEARILDLPTYPFERRQYWFLDHRERAARRHGIPESRPGSATPALRLLEDGRLEELAALIGGSDGDSSTVEVLGRLAARLDLPRSTEPTTSDQGSAVTDVGSPARPAVSAIAADEQIAIVSVACRFPGAPDPESFWEMMSGGVDAIGDIPEDRFDVDEFYDPDPGTPGKTYSRHGGYLDGIDQFEPEFFGISATEAIWIEPQQRLMLETVWEGLERAGYAPESLRGSRTGVFTGVSANEYSQLLASESVERLDPNFITGNALNAIPGRVAFTLGWEGPAVAIDTGGSSALVAVHQACQALRSGDCDVALAGGVNVLLSRMADIAAARAQLLSPVGRCKTFDAAADGYVRSEGCGVLVLKRLSDAVRDGDQVQAVISSSAVNQDGASGGLTAPSGVAQERLIGAALTRAGLVGGDVDYLEAHGSGTPADDPVEVRAAAAAFGAARDADRPLLLGSVKTNIGHLESASGAAGLIKVVLSLQHELLPQNLHFDRPSPHIAWDTLPVRVVDEATPWQTNGRTRRAGVSSFGLTGTNAHVLIEEAPTRPPAGTGPDTRVEPEGGHGQSNHVLTLSARSAESLTALAQRYAQWLSTHPDADLGDVCVTAGTGRAHFEHRAALVVDSVAGARDGLSELAQNRLRPGVLRAEHRERPTTAWMFTGQGSQYAGMARELFDAEPVFADTVRRCAEAVDDILPQPLLDVVFSTDRDAGGSTGRNLRHTSFAQPALFAIEMGLARLWQSWGVQPDVVLGHSVGEYAAACVAGVFSLEDGARLIAERGRLFGSLPDGGRMVAVFTDAAEVDKLAGEFPSVSVGAYNGPNTVLSGPAAALEEIVSRFDEEGIRCTWLETSHAFHSELLEPVLAEFESYAATVEFAVPTIPLVSNRNGAVLTTQTPIDATYWRRHSRQPVQFAESVRTVAALGCSVLMEIGPQPVLTGAAVQVWPEHLAAPHAIVSLRKGVDDRRQIADAVAAAYVGGHDPDLTAIDPGPHRRLALPTYPFHRRRFWPRSSDTSGSFGSAAVGILGQAKDLASGDSVFTSRWSVKTQPWLADHVIYGTVVVPGATYAAMALAAVGAPCRLDEVFIYEPIILPERSSREVQLTLHPLDGGAGWSFTLHSRPHGARDADWSLNSDGTISSGLADDSDSGSEADQREPIDATIERMSRMRPQELFDVFAEMELAWGSIYSGSLKSLWVGDGEAVGDLLVGEELGEHLGTEPIHPVLLDLCTGVAFPSFPALLAAEQGINDIYLPVRYGRVDLAERMPRRFYCRATWHTAALDGETQVFDLDFVDRDDNRLGGIRDFTVKRAPREALLRGLFGDATRLLYTVGWHEVPIPPAAEDADGTPGTWLVAGFDALAAAVPGCIPFDRSVDEQPLGRVLAEAHERGLPFAGVVWRCAPAADDEPTAAVTARVESELAHLLSAVHAVQGGEVRLPGGLFVVTDRAVSTDAGERVDPAQSALWGFGRTTINEEPRAGVTLLDCDASPDAARAVANLLRAPVAEHELAVRQGRLLASRLLPWSRSGNLTVPRSQDYTLAPVERGSIDNLRLIEADVPDPEDGYVQVRVEAAGLNFRDVLNVLGLYPGDPGAIGGDFAGTVTQLGDGVSGLQIGQRVYGFMQGAFSNRFNVPAQLVAPLPDGVSAVDAATLPAAALTVRLAFDWAEVKPGDRVLVHAATGGVGLMAVQLARQRGATVYATASTHKRAALRELGIEHVYDSRTTDFADQILADTDGAGVDVVLNSLTNDGFIDATVRATAPNGRFAEIAKRDIWTPEQMAETRPDIAYEIVALDTLTFLQPERVRGLLAEVTDGLVAGDWTPLPAEIYPVTEARSAFRRMQQARHIGKIVLRMPDPLQPRGDRSYLVTGGLGAIGLHVAADLAQRGAGDIVLSSRRPADPDTAQVIEDLADRYGARIHVFPADIGDDADAARLLTRIRAELQPLAGVVHLAGVLDDGLLMQQTFERFQTVLRPKAYGALHLDGLTRSDDLDFFVVSSSVSSLFGTPGQANYAAANALLDGLIARRQALGLPATGVNFGPWAQGGMASSDAASATMSAQGMIPLEPSTALGALAEILANGTGQAAVIKANWQRMAKALGGSRPPMLDLVLPSEVGEVSGDSELLQQLLDTPLTQRADFVTEFLQREVQNFLRLASPPAATSRFLDLGTDSLIAIELRNRVYSQFGGVFTINATAVFDYPTIGGLAEYLVTLLPDAEAGPEAGPEPDTGAEPPPADDAPVIETAPAASGAVG